MKGEYQHTKDIRGSQTMSLFYEPRPVYPFFKNTMRFNTLISLSTLVMVISPTLAADFGGRSSIHSLLKDTDDTDHSFYPRTAG